MLNLIIFAILLIAAIISLFIYKKINPDSFGVYFGYVIGIILIGLIVFKPWGIFI